MNREFILQRLIAGHKLLLPYPKNPWDEKDFMEDFNWLVKAVRAAGLEARTGRWLEGDFRAPRWISAHPREPGAKPGEWLPFP